MCVVRAVSLFLKEGSICNQMGREVLEGMRALIPEPAVPTLQENQQTDHCPYGYCICRLTHTIKVSLKGLAADHFLDDQHFPGT